MKISTSFKNTIVEIICLLYILLFVYAAVSKLLDFENFQVQLGQSPLLGAFADYIVIGIPVVELLITLLLVFPKYRLFGLFGSFSLMVMFTAYIYIILNFSSFVPCSCGGILEKLGWTEHIIFNIVFILLATVGILFHTSTSLILRSRKRYIALLISSILSAGFVWILFISSENIIHHHNNFVRRFPHFPATEEMQFNLRYNSYYLAGADNGKIYLGNYTTPFQISVLDSTLKTKVDYYIQPDRTDLPYKSVQIKVHSQDFYLFDGTVPCIFKGKISDWKAVMQPSPNVLFSQAEAIDSTNVIFRTFMPKTGENAIARFNYNQQKITYGSNVLEKQIDGIFDTDGTLQYNKNLKKVIYIYRYRNQYIIANPELIVEKRGKTIDTFSRAKIKITYLPKLHQTKMSAPPVIVNKGMASYKNLLFVNSALAGKYESDKLWDTASTIDVYNMYDQTYLFSFYIYNVNGDRLNSFLVSGNHFYALIGTQLVDYRLNNIIRQAYSNEAIK